MPRYSVDITHIITAEEAMDLIKRARNPRNKFLVAILYMTGARIGEIADLEAKDFSPVGFGYYSVHLITKKLGKNANPLIRKRILELPEASPFSPYILSWKNSQPEGKVLKCSLRTLKDIITKLSKGKLCCNSFRHSRLTKLSQAGATINELMYWKGAREYKSVEPYIRAKPIGRKLVIE